MRTTRLTQLPRHLLIAAAAAVLTACGGGGQVASTPAPADGTSTPMPTAQLILIGEESGGRIGTDGRVIVNIDRLDPRVVEGMLQRLGTIDTGGKDAVSPSVAVSGADRPVE